MKRDDLKRKFKAETGLNSIRETDLDLEECEYIDDYYLIRKTEADKVKDDDSISVTTYNPKYIDWLEEHFKD